MSQKVAVILAVAGVLVLAWMIPTQLETVDRLRTATAFIQDMVFLEAVTACENADLHFQYKKAKEKRVMGLTSFQSEHGLIIHFGLYADGRYCSYSPLGKSASVGP